MIVFQEVRYKNFLSSGNADTTILLNPEHPLNLIKGDNGSGKSTLLDVLCWGLYGKAFRKINKTDVVNSINGKDCEVFIDFTIGNDTYTVTRGVKPNVYEFHGKGQRILDKTPEEVLGIDYKTFCNICILGSANYVPFMQLPAADRRALIEDLLDIKVFSEMNKILKDKATEMANKVSRKSIQRITADSKVDMLKKQASTAADLNNEKIVEIQGTITKMRAEIAKLEAEWKSVVPDAGAMNKNQTNRTELSNIEGKLQSRIDEENRTRRFFVGHVSCPKCLQNIDESIRQIQLTKIDQEVVRLTDGMSKLLVKKKELENEWNGYDKKLQKAHELAKEQSKVATLVNDYEKRLSELQSTVVPDSLLTDIDDAEKELNKIQNEEVELHIESSYILMGQKILKDDGVKATIIKQYLPLINQYMNEYLKTMDFFVNIEFDEEFNETIKARHRDAFSYEHFSEGERMRVDLALLLTWRKIATLKSRMDTNLLILDEVFDSSMDETGIDGFMKLLSSPEWKDRNVFVISHKGDAMTDKFDNVITFEKQTFSRIV